jgi:ribonuclease HI
MFVEIYTDGAAQGNPGKGGYGTILTYGGKEKELSEGYRLTTNNRMELLAVIKGLEILNKDNLKVKIYSDSKYVVDAVNKKWLNSWIKTDFKNKKNEDLWRRFYNVSKKHTVELIWIKGHNGHEYNERCDILAVKAAENKNLLIDDFYENLQKNIYQDL